MLARLMLENGVFGEVEEAELAGLLPCLPGGVMAPWGGGDMAEVWGGSGGVLLGDKLLDGCIALCRREETK